MGGCRCLTFCGLDCEFEFGDVEVIYDAHCQKILTTTDEMIDIILGEVDKHGIISTAKNFPCNVITTAGHWRMDYQITKESGAD
jgi:hypothetical protein